MYSVPVLFFLLVSPVWSAMPDIIDGGWLISNKNDKALVVLDIQPREYYQQYHVPGAVNAPYSLWKTGKKGKPPGMMPPINKLELMLGKLGIERHNKVVIVATGTGAGDMAAAARVFWTFKVLGHEAVAILDGGLASYANEFKGSLSNQAASRPEKTYSARPDATNVANANDVLNAVKAKNVLLDARSRGEYLGVMRGSKKERPGTIPGAKNLPFDWMLANFSGRLRDQQQLKKLFKSVAADKNSNTIHFCHTGSRAALTWFVDYAVLGHRKARLYDGSMIEWAADKNKPVELILSLPE